MKKPVPEPKALPGQSDPLSLMMLRQRLFDEFAYPGAVNNDSNELPMFIDGIPLNPAKESEK